MNLLATNWDSDPCLGMPDDDLKLCKLADLPMQTWMQVRSEVLANFVLNTIGRWTNSKLLEQWKETKSFIIMASRRGQAGAEARWKKHASSNAQAMQNDGSSPAPSSAPASAYKDLKTKPAAAPLVVPEWVPLDAWNAYVEMRGVRHKVTVKGAVLIFKKLLLWKEKGQDPRAVLEQSVMNGWTGIFELKESGNGRKSDDPNERVRQSLKNLGFDPTARPS